MHLKLLVKSVLCDLVLHSFACWTVIDLFFCTGSTEAVDSWALTENKMCTDCHDNGSVWGSDAAFYLCRSITWTLSLPKTLPPVLLLPYAKLCKSKCKSSWNKELVICIEIMDSLSPYGFIGLLLGVNVHNVGQLLVYCTTTGLLESVLSMFFLTLLVHCYCSLTINMLLNCSLYNIIRIFNILKQILFILNDITFIDTV